MSGRKFLSFLTCIIIAILLASSSVLAKPALPTTEQAGSEETPLSELRSTLPLAFTAWQLESYGEPGNLLPADPNAPGTVNFFLSRYAGYDGCNWFLGVYEVVDPGLYMYSPSQTRIYCPDNPQQGMLIASLMNILEYELVDDKLIGYTTDNQQLLTLVPAQTQPLEGTVWNLAFMAIPSRDPVPLLTDTSITAQIADGELSGSAGCETYTASFESRPNEFEGDQLVSATVAIGEVQMSAADPACSEPEDTLEQQQHYLTLLNSVSSYGVLGSTLVMFGELGQPVLMFGAGGQVSSDS